jgi:hypothetical protein
MNADPTATVELEEHALVCRQAEQKVNDPVPGATSCLNSKTNLLVDVKLTKEADPQQVALEAIMALVKLVETLTTYFAV